MAGVRLLSLEELKTLKGIRFHRQTIWRLVKAGQFPAPIKLWAATNAWAEHEIDEWIQSRIGERDAAAAVRPAQVHATAAEARPA
jgi:prophage regulatory protein